MHREPFKVAIVGGGIGGLALAVGLNRNGIKVDIFEQAPRFEEIGAGVGIGANGVRALNALGILDVLLESTQAQLEMRSFVMISGLPGQETIYDYPALDSDMGMAIHRAHFLDILVNLIPPGAAHFHKKCASVSQSDSDNVILTFEDGTTHISDVVIGCDGIRSTVRSAVVGRPANPTFSRTVAFRGLIPEKDAVAALGGLILHRPINLLGPDRHVIVFPIKGKHIVKIPAFSESIDSANRVGTQTNIVAFSTDRSRPAEAQAPPPGQPWVIASTQSEMLEQFVGWDPNVLNLLKNIKHPNKWLLHSQNPPLESYIRGRVALLGDAAHSMLPHLGAGAGQAMEDALLLSCLLTHPLADRTNLEVVLQAYDHIRRPRANRILTASYECGEIYEHAGPSGASMEGLQRDLSDIWEYVWHHDLDEDFRAAVKYLEDGLACKAISS